MDNNGSNLELWTHSRSKCFQDCKRKHFYSYELGRRPIKQAPALTFGSAFHAWVEVWLTSRMDPELEGAGTPWVCPVAPPGVLHEDRSASDLMRHRGLEMAFEALSAEDPFEAAKLRAMVLAYHLRWRAIPWRVRAVEIQFRAPMVNPETGRPSQIYQRGGKIDAIIDDPTWDDMHVVVEHKTHFKCLDAEDVYWQKLRMDSQCSDYFIGATAHGYRPGSIIYDVACKPAIEPYTMTPVEKQEKTIGKGCVACGGVAAKSKKHPDGVKRGKGTVNDKSVTRPCDECDGTGWDEEPRYKAHVRLRDETPGEYGMRCFLLILEDPERYLHRRKVVRLADELREHQVDGWHSAQEMTGRRNAGVWPRNSNSCFNYNRPCDYFNVCSGVAKITDDRYFRKVVRHPELRVIDE